jgi:PHP family Zn ribbon phosphoesterase
MKPHAIVARAVERGLDVIGICDHNAAGNAGAVLRAAAGSRLTVIPGLEITTREEVHILGLFESVADALKMQDFVWSHLPGKNDPAAFGSQLLVNGSDAVAGECDRLLAGATDLSLGAVLGAIHGHGGCAIAAHVDRERFGIVGQLGFVPPALAIDGLEHTTRIERAEARARFADHGRWELICCSDAHRLDEIGAGSTVMTLKNPTAADIQRALHGENGRRVVE